MSARPDVIFDALWGYQRTAALVAGLELDVFTAIDDGASTAADISMRCAASERGVRVLCDYLTTIGLLAKSDASYALTPDSRAFLSRRSRAFLGTTATFMAGAGLKLQFDDLTGAVRRGGATPDHNLVAGENPLWVEFARAMVPLAIPPALAISSILALPSIGRPRVLDIAAGHGMFGITIARRNPHVEVVAADSPSVLDVARSHAEAHGIGERYHTLPGDVFTVPFGTHFDVALVTNFLHHFDHDTCTAFLRKVHGALATGGRVALLEFVPNPDRVSPPVAASFSLTMLAGTPHGDAYTLAELTQQLGDAGFTDITAHTLPSPETVIVAQKV